MAGLIKQNMGMGQDTDTDQEQEPPAEMQQEAASGAEPMPPGGQPPQDPAAQQDDGTDETDPNFQQALKFAMDALYKGGAAKQIAEQIRKAQDVPETLADAAYNIVTITDEKTQGKIPDQLLVLFASNILEEVADIADAAGIKLKPADIALALKNMILRYLGENGVDTTQLSAAMDKVDPEEFNKHAAGQEK